MLSRDSEALPKSLVHCAKSLPSRIIQTQKSPSPSFTRSLESR